MANGMEGLFIGNAGLLTAQHALNTIANNVANNRVEGYVRQEAFQADMGYNFMKNSAIGKQMMGLGVSIGEIIHTRDEFLDRSYRTESGRQTYYDAYNTAISEVENMYQELDGEAFKDVLTGDSSFWTAFQQLAQDPSDTVNQGMVIQKANLLITRGNSIYSSMQIYQNQINIEIRKDIERANELGEEIRDLNLGIQKIEGGRTETAYDLRDQRDRCLDELATLFKIEYAEDETGLVRVKLEGQYFVDDGVCNKMGEHVDKATGFVDPYWPYLSNETNDDYYYVLDYSQGISTTKNTDIGEVKALVQARGYGVTNYTQIVGADPEKYAKTTGMSVMEESEAQLDNLIHGIATEINDIFCPNRTASFTEKIINADGSYTTIDYHDILVLDEENCNVGADGKLPPQELFCRVGTDRYKAVTPYEGKDANGNDIYGKTYYVYMAEDIEDTRTLNLGGKDYQIWDPEKGNGYLTIKKFNASGDQVGRTEVNVPFTQYDNEKTPKYKKEVILGKQYYVRNEDYAVDKSTQYTLSSLNVNDRLENQVSLLPHKTLATGEIDYDMGRELTDIWNKEVMTIYPGSAAKFSFANYYTEMIGNLASAGNTYQSTSTTLYNSCTALDNQRLQVTGVSTDEELTNMVKYQNAYNAASRYIQVVSDMLNTLVSSLT